MVLHIHNDDNNNNDNSSSSSTTTTTTTNDNHNNNDSNNNNNKFRSPALRQGPRPRACPPPQLIFIHLHINGKGIHTRQIQMHIRI